MAQQPADIVISLIHREEFLDGHITCIDFVEKYLAVGTNKGSIYVFRIDDNKMSVEFTRNHHPTYAINNIKCWGNAPYVKDIKGFPCPRIAVTQTTLVQELKFWNYDKLRSLTSPPMTGKILSQGWTNQFCCVSGRTVIQCYKAQSDGNISSLWSLILPIKTQEEKIVAFSNTHHLNSNIFVLTYNEKSGMVSQYQIANTDKSSPTLSFYPWSTHTNRAKLLAGTVGLMSLTGIKKFYLYDENISICVANKRLAFSIKDSPWVNYNTEVMFGSQITNVWMFNGGRCLVLSLATGVIRGYMVNDYERWKDSGWSSVKPFLDENLEIPIVGIRHRVCTNRVVQIITATQLRVFIHMVIFPEACIMIYD